MITLMKPDMASTSGFIISAAELIIAQFDKN